MRVRDVILFLHAAMALKMWFVCVEHIKHQQPRLIYVAERYVK